MLRWVELALIRGTIYEHSDTSAKYFNTTSGKIGKSTSQATALQQIRRVKIFLGIARVNGGMFIMLFSGIFDFPHGLFSVAENGYWKGKNLQHHSKLAQTRQFHKTRRQQDDRRTRLQKGKTNSDVVIRPMEKQTLNSLFQTILFQTYNFHVFTKKLVQGRCILNISFVGLLLGTGLSCIEYPIEYFHFEYFVYFHCRVASWGWPILPAPCKVLTLDA